MVTTSPHQDPRYVDSHVHLDRYVDEDVARLLDHAARVGVAGLLTVGVDAATSRRAVELAERDRTPCRVYASPGLHPAFLPAEGLAAIDRELDQLRHIAQASPASVVAIGETGLDTVESTAPLETQVSVFVAQIRLANALDLPVILHSQGAEAIARAHALYANLPAQRGAVVHYFVGNLAEARRWIDLGCHLSVGKPLLRSEQAELRAAVASTELPLERLLVETDAYPLPGRTTEPADVVAVAAEVAALKRLPDARVAEKMLATFTRLFRVAI